MARERSWSDDDLVAAVAESVSKRQVLDILGLRPTGGNYTKIQGHFERLGLDTSHFTGQGHNSGDNYVQPRATPLSEILVENSTYKNTSNLAKRLVREGRLKQQCDSCGLEKWMGQPIPLELDHENGDHFDNRIENLRFLCRNCHGLTSTFRGKNMSKKSFRAEKDLKTGPKTDDQPKRPVFKLPT